MGKTLYIKGGASTDIKTLDNGDKLNSTWTLKDDAGNILFHSEHCSRPPSKLLFGKNQVSLHGIMGQGKFVGKYFLNVPNLGDAVKIFRLEFKDAIQNGEELTEEMMTFDSIKNNPSMGGQKKVSFVYCHSTNGDQGNGSEGCQTCYYKEFHAAYAGKNSFENQLKEGEIIDIIIEDTPEYAEYLNKLSDNPGL